VAPPRARVPTRADWLAGLTVGFGGGFLLIYGPPIGALIIVGFGGPSVVRRAAAPLAGLLVGSGAVILTMLALANANCAGNYGSPEGPCTPADLTGWFATGGTLLVVGWITTVVAVRTARRT
jgi:hypothetical protein